MSTMKKDKFDFSEEMDKVDRSIDTAMRQEAEHDALEENLEALHELNIRTEELTGAFRKSSPTRRRRRLHKRENELVKE